jgi:malonate decarboxylase delta subunit
VEQFQVRGTAKKRAPGDRRQAITGVNTSGNLQILVERVLPDQECLVDVATAVTGFRGIWEAVIQEFFERSSPGSWASTSSTSAGSGSIGRAPWSPCSWRC